MPHIEPEAIVGLQSVLRAGNLVAAARSRCKEDWRRYAALGLIGAGGSALARLAATDDPQSRIFHALCLWIDGQDAAAEAILAQAPASRAAECLRVLLQKDRIEVLAFLPPNSNGPHGIFGAVGADPRFHVRCVWFGAGREGIENRIGGSIHDFYRSNAKPDLLICEMVEWHVLPPNLAEAPFLKVGHTSDFDIHGPEVLPWLKLFDVVLTLDHTEWSRLRRALPQHTIMNYPKLFTVEPPDIDPLTDRPIDVLMTGTVYSDYHHDKNELVTRLRNIPGLKCVLLNGFISAPEYMRLTQQSKSTLSYVRHSGTMPTRALESLALGTWAIVQHDTALRLYLPDDAALLPYTAGEWDRFAADVSGFVSNYPDRHDEYVERAVRTRALVCQAFAPKRVASQYLRFCAALPALAAAVEMPPHPILRGVAQPLMKRGCVSKGWLPAGGNETVMREIMEANCRVAEVTAGVSGFNDCGRERLIEYARLSLRGVAAPALLDACIQAFERAIATDPSALAPRFNLMRAGFHFGNAAVRTRAAFIAEDTLRRHGDSDLKLALDDDLLPYDFYPSHFHAQLACDLRLDAMGGDIPALERIKTLIVASIHYYLARNLGIAPAAEKHYRAAIDLDADHVHFQIGLCEYLLAASPQQNRLAVDLLKNIVGRRAWTPLLEALVRRVCEDHADIAEDKPNANIIFLDVEDELARDHRYRLARCHDMTGAPYFGTVRLSGLAPRLTLMLCGAGASTSAKVRTSLRKLRERIGDIEVILIDTALDVRPSASFEVVDVLITAPQPGATAYSSKAIFQAVDFVRAPYVLIARPDTFSLDVIIDWTAHAFRASDQAANPAEFDGRPLVLTRDDPGRAPAGDILAVGIGTELLRKSGLPQRIGMLQDARLVLPLLVHQLRPFVEAYHVVDLSTGRACDEPTDSAALELDRFVSPFEDKTLHVVSPNWRQFRAGPGISFRVLMKFDRSSLVYRLAQSIYRHSLARRPNRLWFSVHSQYGDMVLNLGRLYAEHTSAGLTLKIRRPSRGTAPRPNG